MRSRTIPMTEAEFLCLRREVGWKYEYYAGMAHVRPRHLVAQLRAPVTPRILPDTGCRLRALTPADTECLVRAFVSGFRDTVEYCDCSTAQVQRAGEDAIATFFSGRRGAFHEASRLACPRHRPRLIAGAALIVRKPEGPFLDILFVRSEWQHRGLATALTGAVMNALHEAGEASLGSAYNVANAPSMAWHTRFGFVEQPGALLASARAQAARHELWRRELMGDLTDADRAALEAEAAHWEQVGEALDEVFSRRAAAGAPGRLSPA